MRKILESVSIATLAALFGISWYALHGPNSLPSRIPTHFNAQGQADGWGSPASLWLLPAVAVALYLVISVVAMFPAAFNLPGRPTGALRARLEAITLKMISWIKAELACLFLFIQWSILQSVRNGQGIMPPLIVPFFLVIVFGTVVAHAVLLFRAARKPMQPGKLIQP
jgi:uncharacterized membrane protein